MKPKKRMTRAGAANVALLCLLGLAIGPVISRAEPVMPTGLRESTPEESAALAPYRRWITGIRLTPLGQQRLVEAQSLRGMTKNAAQLATLAVSAFGEELELTQAPPKSADGALDIKGLADAGLNVEMLSLPASVDNSTLAAFPPIGSQGSAGSCAAFSTTYYQLTYTLALQRGWNAKSGGTSYHMSPKWTFNMLNGGGDSASRDACLIMGIQNGCATWAEFPYDSDYKAWVYNNVPIWRAALNRRLSVWGTVNAPDTDEGLYRLKQLLNNGHILTFGTYVTSWSQATVGDDPATADDNSFVGQKICRYVDGSAGPHAMTIVGYNDALWCDINANGTVDAGEKGALKIANQWVSDNSNWNSGFRWLAYDALRKSSRVPGVSGPAGRTPAITLGDPTWVAAQPQAPCPLVGVFRIRHAKRGQLGMFISIGTTNDTSTSPKWFSHPLYDGGNYGFDGGTYGTLDSAPAGTFALSMDAIQPVAGEVRRYFLGMRDDYSAGAGRIEAFELQDLSGNVLATSTNTPITVDNATKWVWIDYRLLPTNATFVSVAAVQPTASELGALPGVFRFSRTGDTSQACRVSFSLSGTASESSDFLPLPRLIEIPAGASNADLQVMPIDDWVVEDTEAVVLNLIPGPVYYLDTASNATISIVSDDTLAVRIPPLVRVLEGTTKVVQGVLTGPPRDPLDLFIVKSSGTFTLPSSPMVVRRDATNWWQPFDIAITVPNNANVGINMVGFTVDGNGLQNVQVAVHEIDNDTSSLLPLEDWPLYVPEGGSAPLHLKLTMQPAQTVTAQVYIASGSLRDPDITVDAVSNLVFNTANWDTWQEVLIHAAEDSDGINGTSKFSVKYAGNSWREFEGTVCEIDNDTQRDTDGDGMSDMDEDTAGTDPAVSNSVFRVAAIAGGSSGGAQVELDSATNRVYVLYGITNLTAGATAPWATVGVAAGTGGRIGIVDTNRLDRRFYRLRVMR
jgi:hypothetical protein